MASTPAPADGLAETRAALAPTGTLRVALFKGSPASYVVGRDGEPAGVTYELARLAGKRLGLPLELIELPRAAEAFEAIMSGRADFTMTNASEARRQGADFTAPLLRTESGYLVSADCGIADMAGIDRPGVRVGVAEGGSSHVQLARELKKAELVPVKSLAEAAQKLGAGAIDAFASGKGILYEVAAEAPGSRVLPGCYGHENLAIAIPKGRPAAALDWAQAFAAGLRGSPDLQAMVERAGLRGTTEG
jgi:polar amino acid transport system substrate-binding protein